ncbi:hypothetical protein AB0L14_12450 [Streptomyces sp. NPDC052727]|uniref:hypothetical protein n=1 Tax=Streptomyces sp. NPDC052727 TaxID=3154854 RepID=UPI003422AB99
MDVPRPQRNRVHVDVWVSYDRAEARTAAAVAARAGRTGRQPAAARPAWGLLRARRWDSVAVRITAPLKLSGRRWPRRAEGRWKVCAPGPTELCRSPGEPVAIGRRPERCGP